MKRRRKSSRRRHRVGRRSHRMNRGHRKIHRRHRRNKGKVSAYARFVGQKMRAGMSMKAAARAWKHK